MLNSFRWIKSCIRKNVSSKEPLEIILSSITLKVGFIAAIRFPFLAEETRLKSNVWLASVSQYPSWTEESKAGCNISVVASEYRRAKAVLDLLSHNPGSPWATWLIQKCSACLVPPVRCLLQCPGPSPLSAAQWGAHLCWSMGCDDPAAQPCWSGWTFGGFYLINPQVWEGLSEL